MLTTIGTLVLLIFGLLHAQSVATIGRLVLSFNFTKLIGKYFLEKVKTCAQYSTMSTCTIDDIDYT